MKSAAPLGWPHQGGEIPLTLLGPEYPHLDGYSRLIQSARRPVQGGGWDEEVFRLGGGSYPGVSHRLVSLPPSWHYRGLPLADFRSVRDPQWCPYRFAAEWARGKSASRHWGVYVPPFPRGTQPGRPASPTPTHHGSISSNPASPRHSCAHWNSATPQPDPHTPALRGLAWMYSSFCGTSLHPESFPRVTPPARTVAPGQPCGRGGKNVSLVNTDRPPGFPVAGQPPGGRV